MLAFKIRSFIWRTTLVMMLSSLAVAHASISLSSTRVIFNGGAKEASVTVRNGISDGDILIQSWVESNTPDDEGDLPFAITPPLAKMGSGAQQLVRIIYAGGQNELPNDKESVFWLNVQEIPQTTSDVNTLQLAVRQRIKMFYRPKDLVGSSATAPQELHWFLTEQSGEKVLQIENPSAYHVTITGIKFESGSNKQVVDDANMLAPGESIEIPAAHMLADGVLQFTTINDYGGTDQYQILMESGKAVEVKQVNNQN